MQATTPSITNVFERTRILRIPFFQRQYVWEEKDWERFVSDMYSLIDTEKQYFLGALILKEEPIEPDERAYGIREKLSVVDGQQRLTTLSIFMKILYMLTSSSEEFNYQFKNRNSTNDPILRPSYNDRMAYYEIMNLDVLTDKPKCTDKSIVQAYLYMLKEIKRRGCYSELKNAIDSNVCFVEIKLHQQDDEKQIFETINSLGVDLTTDEMLKNFLYSPNEEERYLSDWKPAFDDTASRRFWGTDDASRKQAKTEKTKTIETFILHFVKVQMWKYKDRFERNARKRLVAKNDLYNSCKSFVLNYGEDRLALANEIIEYSKLYREYFDKEALNKRIPLASESTASSSIYRLACYAMVKESTIIPYLLYILRHVPDVEMQMSMFGYLEKYLLRRVVSMPNNKNKNFVEFFSETLIGSGIDSLEKLKDRINSIEEGQNHAMPSDDMIMKNINSIEIEEDTAKLFLYMLETRFEYREGLGYNQYAVDAIMPKPDIKNSSTWQPHSDEAMESLRKTRSKTIGNYLLLLDNNSDRRIDIKSYKNEPWDNKKDWLKNNSVNIRTSQWFIDKNQWDENAIIERNNLVAKIVISQLKID